MEADGPVGGLVNHAQLGRKHHRYVLVYVPGSTDTVTSSLDHWCSHVTVPSFRGWGDTFFRLANMEKQEIAHSKIKHSM